MSSQRALDVDEVALDVADDMPGMFYAEVEAALVRVLQVAIVPLDSQTNVLSDGYLATEDGDAVGVVPFLPGFDRRYQPL